MGTYFDQATLTQHTTNTYITVPNLAMIVKFTPVSLGKHLRVGFMINNTGENKQILGSNGETTILFTGNGTYAINQAGLLIQDSWNQKMAFTDDNNTDGLIENTTYFNTKLDIEALKKKYQ